MDKNKKPGVAKEAAGGKKENAHRETNQKESKKDKNKKPKLTQDDFRGKKVDAFPDVPEDQPLQRNE